MLKELDKMLLAGLGAVSMTRKRAGKIFDELVRRGQTARGSRSGFVQGMADAARKTRNDLEQLVARKVRQVVSKVNLATREDLSRLEKRVDEALRRKSKRA
jgi:polyhydroxyalkanoate synthesis regulator phasin